MLNIKDLAVATSLDAQQMAAISGGFNANLSQIGANTRVGVFSPVVTQSNLDVAVDASSHSTTYGKHYPKWISEVDVSGTLPGARRPAHETRLSQTS